MRSPCRIRAFWFLCLLATCPPAFVRTVPGQTLGVGSERPAASSPAKAEIQDTAVKQVIQSIADKLSSIKTYQAEVETQSRHPDGGFDKFRDELMVRSPDRMRVNRKVLVAHNKDAVGEKITVVVDGTWLFTRSERGPLTSEQKKRYTEMATRDAPNRTKEQKDKDVANLLSLLAQPRYSMVNLKAVEQAGGLSVREYVALMGNLADPLSPYTLETLKIERETGRQWILLAEYKQAGAPWPRNRLTIDKKTGILKTVEALIPQVDKPVVLLTVKKFSPNPQLDDSLFTMNIPASDSSGYPRVSDNTKSWIDSVKSR